MWSVFTEAVSIKMGLQKNGVKKKRKEKASRQHLQVNIVHLFFCAKAAFFSRAFDPFDLPSLFFFLKTDLLCAKNSLLFHRNASPPPGYWCFFPGRGYDMVNHNFKAPGQYTHSRLFFFFLTLSLSLLSDPFFSSFSQSPGSNPHFSNEYKYLFCECVRWRHIRTLSTHSLSGQQVAAQLSLALPLVLIQPEEGENLTFPCVLSQFERHVWLVWRVCTFCKKSQLFWICMAFCRMYICFWKRFSWCPVDVVVGAAAGVYPPAGMSAGKGGEEEKGCSQRAANSWRTGALNRHPAPLSASLPPPFSASWHVW